MTPAIRTQLQKLVADHRVPMWSQIYSRMLEEGCWPAERVMEVAEAAYARGLERAAQIAISHDENDHGYEACCGDLIAAAIRAEGGTL